MIVSCLLLLCLALLLCVWYMAARCYSVSLTLADYTTLARNRSGVPTAVIDVDAILSDLGLPNPRRFGVDADKYPDVKALMSMKLRLEYTDEDDVMLLTVQCDTDTLARYGIRIDTLSWEQQIKGFVADDTTGASPSPSPTTLPAASFTPADTVAEEDGYLTSLLDSRQNGYDLRAVCERVQKERDSLCVEIFGNNYDTAKTNVYFIVSVEKSAFVNLYRACYTASLRSDTDEALIVYFTVDVYDLQLVDGKVYYGDVDVTLCNSESEASSLNAFPQTSYTTCTLYGGGVLVSGKTVFDQNGFVRFPDKPTSFRMANGVYWSPSYDLLSEESIWQLTATDNMSLAKLLRYARKEIYARHGLQFDPTAEREFAAYYAGFDWYEALHENVDALLTDAEKANVSLLREIQTLIEH